MQPIDVDIWNNIKNVSDMIKRDVEKLCCSTKKY